MHLEDVPPDLRHGPFHAADVARHGLTQAHLRGRAFRRVFAGVHVWAGLPDTPLLRTQAAALLLPRGGIVTGHAALWLRGIIQPPEAGPAPVHVLVPVTSRLDPRPGIVAWSAVIRPGDVTEVDGLPVATVARALLDLGRRVPLEEALCAADAAVWAGAIDPAGYGEYVRRHRALVGIEGARTAARLMRPGVRSQPETRVRLTVVLAGLPEPWLNVPVELPSGVVVVPDFLYGYGPTGFEYDGRQHDSAPGLYRDRDRDNATTAAGLALYRLDHRHLRGDRTALVAMFGRVVAAAERRGLPVGAPRWPEWPAPPYPVCPLTPRGWRQAPRAS